MNILVTIRSYYICAAKIMFRKPLIIFSLFLLSACVDDELCIGTGTNIVKVKLFEFEDPLNPISVTFDSIGVSGNPEFFPSYNDSTISTINLTIDPNETFTRFVFFTTDSSDTLELTYVIKTRLISPSCGPELLYSDLEVIHYTFDSLILDESVIEREIETNIRIYY
jgi:hypothetical protein